ncbi:MAG: AGE family epimerase/isomerase [Rhodoglobus sp.]
MSTESAHGRWLRGEEQRLVEWARRSRTAEAFGYLDSSGQVQPGAGSPLLITARMTYVFSIAAVRGDCDALADAEHGVSAMSPNQGAFWDEINCGWMSRLPGENFQDPGARDKSAYDHSFVLLASATAAIAQVPGATDLLTRAIEVVLTHFWNEEEGALLDSFNEDWSVPEKYRGANSNMHFVEACLVTHAATGDSAWLQRALRVSDRLMNVSARENDWRLLEHYDEAWEPLPQYNADSPDDQFRPFGYLIGHSFEWARLLLQLSWALRAVDSDEPWLAEAAYSLWESALKRGRATDGVPGFVYSLGWDDEPVISLRLHWVICEAVGAAWVLFQETGDGMFLDYFDDLFDEIRRYFVDVEKGSWHHELGVDGEPSSRVWSGKPDVYHAFGAVVLPLVLPTSTVVTGARDVAEAGWSH